MDISDTMKGIKKRKGDIRQSPSPGPNVRDDARRGNFRGKTLRAAAPGTRQATSKSARRVARSSKFHNRLYAGGGPTLKHVLSNLRKERKGAFASGEMGNLKRLRGERDQLLQRRAKLLKKMVPSARGSMSASPGIKGARMVSGRANATDRYRKPAPNRPPGPSYRTAGASVTKSPLHHMRPYAGGRRGVRKHIHRHRKHPY
jgi:hypothetical protein